MTFDALAAQVDVELRTENGDEHAWARAFTRKVASLSPQTLGELYVSLAPYAGLLAPERVRDGESPAVARMHLCATRCRDGLLEVPPDRIGDFVALIVATKISQYTVSPYFAKRVLRQLTDAIDKGGQLTAHDSALLFSYAEAVRGERRYSEGDNRTVEEIVVPIERLAGMSTR